MSANNRPFDHTPDRKHEGDKERTDSLPAWSHLVSPIIGRLRTLADTTEGQFISLGNRIGDYRYRAEALADMACETLAIMSNQTLMETMSRLQSLQTSLSQKARQTEECVDQALGALDVMKVAIQGLKAPLDGFRRVTKNLCTLGISSRIETARLSANTEGFVILAENVEKLSHLIATKLYTIRERADSVFLSINETCRIVTGFDREESASDKSILSGIASALGDLKTALGLCLESGRRISSETKKIATSLSSIMMDMQFHDIARQKIEYVCSALSDLVDESSTTKGGPGHGDMPASQPLQAWVLLVEHLSQAKEEFVSASENILSSLHHVAAAIGETVSEFQKAIGGDQETGKASMAHIEHTVFRLLSLLREDSEKIRMLSDTMLAIKGTVDDMTVFLSDIEEIGSEIELIALNARVKSVSIGADGAPLSVVSNAIQSLSSDAYTHTSSIMAHLEAMRNATEQLLTTARMADAGHSSDLDALSISLSTFNQTAMPLLIKIEKLGQDLFLDLDQTARSFDAHRLFVSEIEADLAKLQSLGGVFQGTDRSVGGAGTGGGVCEHDTHPREKDDQAPLLGNADLSRWLVPDHNRGNEKSDAQGLGDNVDLF